MTHDNGAYVNRGFTLFRTFDAPDHGWHIDADLMARKCDLSITAHGLHFLVRDVGWREAERIIHRHQEAVNAR